MPRPDNFYAVRFRTPAADGGHEHFMVIQYDAASPLKNALNSYKHGFPQIELDVDQKAPVFGSKLEAEAECRRLGAEASQANPERVGAEAQFAPGEANRILHAGGTPPTEGSMEMPG